MPRFDKTGPNAEGPMTGAGFGNCAKNRPRNFAPRRGSGFRGNRRGFRMCLNSSSTITEEKIFLEKRLQEINEYLQDE